MEQGFAAIVNSILPRSSPAPSQTSSATRNEQFVELEEERQKARQNIARYKENIKGYLAEIKDLQRDKESIISEEGTKDLKRLPKSNPKHEQRKKAIENVNDINKQIEDYEESIRRAKNDIKKEIENNDLEYSLLYDPIAISSSSAHPPSSVYSANTRYSDPNLLIEALQQATQDREIKEIIRDLKLAQAAATNTTLAKIKDLLENPPPEPKEPSFSVQKVKQVVDQNPDIAADIYEDVQKEYAKGNVTKDEFEAIVKVIPNDIKDITAFKVKRTPVKYKTLSKEQKEQIKEMRRKKSSSPKMRRKLY